MSTVALKRSITADYNVNEIEDIQSSLQQLREDCSGVDKSNLLIAPEFQDIPPLEKLSVPKKKKPKARKGSLRSIKSNATRKSASDGNKIIDTPLKVQEEVKESIETKESKSKTEKVRLFLLFNYLVN